MKNKLVEFMNRGYKHTLLVLFVAMLTLLLLLAFHPFGTDVPVVTEDWLEVPPKR